MMSGFHNYGDAASLYRFHLQSGVATPSPHIVIIINVIYFLFIISLSALQKSETLGPPSQGRPNNLMQTIFG